MNTHIGGVIGETEACLYLEKAGLKILDRNYSRAGGEIDIIAQDGDTVAFIEVKARRSPRYGSPAEAVTPAKMRNIVRASLCYMQSHKLMDVSVRFDVITVEGEDIAYIRNAFDATNLI